MPLTDWAFIHGKRFQGRKALVTGGAGFIGSHLCEALSILGAQVLVIDDLSGGSAENLGGMANVQLVHASILDRQRLDDAIRGCEFVFHLAALGSVPRSIEEPARYAEVNIGGTLNLLQAARAAGVAKVIFSASSSAYGDSPTLPKREDMPPLPRSPYAATKVAGEALMRAWADSYELDTCSLRYFNIFGPRQNANSAYAAVIAAFAKALLSGQSPVIYGDGLQSRDFTHVENAVGANLLAAAAPRLDGSILNIACGIAITVNDLAGKMAALAGRPDLKPTHLPPRAGDVLHSLADLSLAERALGYRVLVDFSHGLANTWGWYVKSWKTG